MQYFEDEVAKVRWYRQHGLLEFWIGDDQQSLRKRKIDPENEGALLKVLKTSPRGALRRSAMRCLLEGGVATSRSLPVLKKLAVDPEQSTSGPATLGFATIAGPSAIGFLRSLLKHPMRKEKSMVFGFLAPRGDETDLLRAFDLLQRTYSKKPKMGFMGWQAASAEMLEFLCGYPDHAVTQKALAWTLAHWKNFEIDHDTLPYRVPEVGPPSDRPIICLLGRASRTYMQLYSAMEPIPKFVVKPKRLEYAVIPVDLDMPNAARQAARAARLCEGVVCMERSLLKNSVVRESGLAKGRQLLYLKPPRSLDDWGNWHVERGHEKSEAADAANARAVRVFVRRLAAGTA